MTSFLGNACRIAVLVAAAGIIVPAQAEPLRVQPAEPSPPHQAPPPEQAPQSPGSREPGFLGALWNFVDESVSSIGSGLKGKSGDGPSEPTKEAGDAILDAASTVARLPATGVITGRERCRIAANGGPDCRAAADAVCRAKGFRGGRSLDVQAAERCPPQVYISARPPAPGECRIETFVTRAVCQ